MIEKKGVRCIVRQTPQSLPGLRQADRAVCFPLVQRADMASRAITNAFILRQVAYSAKRARTIVHVAIITSSRGNFKCGADTGYAG